MKREYNIFQWVIPILNTLISVLIGGLIVIYANNIQAERSFNLDKEKIRWELKIKIYEEFNEFTFPLVLLDRTNFKEINELRMKLVSVQRRAIVIFENKRIPEMISEIQDKIKERAHSMMDGKPIKSTEEQSISNIVLRCMEVELGFRLKPYSNECKPVLN